MNGAGGKALYERPIIRRHQMGLMNKFGRGGTGMRPQTHIDGAAIEAMIAEHGSPLFVYSQRSLLDRYRDLRDALSRRYPKVRLAWSYKTNYLDAICRTFHREGAYAEVVSPFEYQKAIGNGVSPDRIHWNGPYKPEADLERAIENRSIIHIDNLDEFVRIERVAASLSVRPRLAIRVNMTIEGMVPWSRFGLNLESGQAGELARRIALARTMELVGLHAHIGTFVLDPQAYGKAAAKLATLANELLEETGVKLQFIDLGGGFASRNTLREAYLTGEQATPPFSRYAEAIVEGLAALSYPEADLPTLVLETGRALVDEAGYLVATVEATKRLPDGRQSLVLDAGVNLLFTSFWYKHDVVPAQPCGPTSEPTVMYGPLCMAIDEVRETQDFPALKVGDRVVFRNVGAYNNTQWLQFITLRPAVVMVGAEGRVARIRRAEQLADFASLEALPDWML
ncbi:MAG: diaminopimelate decarboxylase [Polyangia bacterium]|jgi:diaminopimelate decarboxylase